MQQQHPILHTPSIRCGLAQNDAATNATYVRALNYKAALKQVALITAPCCAGPDLVSGDGCSYQLLLHLTPTCTDAGPAVVALTFAPYVVLTVCHWLQLALVVFFFQLLVQALHWGKWWYYHLQVGPVVVVRVRWSRNSWKYLTAKIRNEIRIWMKRNAISIGGTVKDR